MTLVLVVALVAALAWAVLERAARRRAAAVAVEVAAHEPAEERREGASPAVALGKALDAIPQGVVVCDAAGEVVHRNVPAEALTTGRPGEVLVEAAVQELLRGALTGEPGRRTLELYGPPRRTVVVIARPLAGGGGSGGAIAVIDDVSDRRRVEAMRRDFVANISHELKTPVGALVLLAETLADEEDPAVVSRLAARMQGECERVARTIDDLLELSRIEAEESPTREPVAVHLVLAEAADRVRPAAEQKNLALQVAEPSRRLSVIADRRQLVSAVYNLLDNAVKYSDLGSSIDVRADTDGSHVDIVVTDHGYGIPARDLERVFERFYRVDRARSRETGGTGLGLAIVRHVANNHRGEVTVTSAEGEGSTFTLRLPAGPGPVAVSDKEAS